MNKQEIKKTGEYVFYEKLDNGLEIYLLPNNRVKNFYMTLNTKFGSVNTDFKYQGKNYHLPKGTAHFLEHLAFNMPDGTSAHDYLGALGSSINAFTSYDVTAYEVYANSKFKENLSYLLKYVYTPHFTKEIVSGEKGIIIEEIKMYNDNPSTELVWGSYRNIFVNDERRHLITGVIEDIKKMSLDDVWAAYNAFYHPENMFLIITGNFKPEEALAITSETLKEFDFSGYEAPILKEAKEPFKVVNTYEEKAMAVDKPKVTIGIKIPKANFRTLKLSDLELKLYINLAMRINFGSTSLLKEELVSNGIIADSISTSYLETNEYIVLNLMAASEYPDYFIKKTTEKFKNLKVSKEEIDRKIKSTISSLIMSFDEIEAVNLDIQDDIISYGEYITNIYNYYRKLDLEVARKVIDKLNKNLVSIMVLKPKEDK